MVHLSATAIDDTLWAVKMKLCKRHSLADADRLISPLCWYISTGRASTDFLRLLVNTSSRQKATIANRIAKGGTDEDVINSVCQYLGYVR